MILAPVQIAHGERFGKLTVLRKLPRSTRGSRYVCGCECGFSGVLATASQLMKGRVKACLKCSGANGGVCL